MSTYSRVLPHVLGAKRDVENRLATHNRKCIAAAINCQIELAAMFLNEAITRMENK